MTVVGHSAGGASAHGHMVSPLSRGLYQRVIAMSGVSIAGWNTRFPVHRNTSIWQAEEVGCPTGDVQEMVDCLR